MNYLPLGRSGVLVSELCFGTMSFGGDADREESSRMYSACREAGVNFFDCANMYNNGRSEEILGELMASERDELVITSKYTGRFRHDVNGIGSSRRNALLCVEESLKRLKTDRIDLYFIHNFDPLTSIEESIRVMDDLVRQGKILYIGVSNWAAWQIAKALGLQFHYGWNRIECIQPMYNLVKRQAEVELFPLAEAEKLGVITYGPLAGGLLSGRYGKGKKPATGRFAEKTMYQRRYDGDEYYTAADEFVAYAKAHELDPVSLGVAWVGSHSAVTAPIIGARSAEQLKSSLAAPGIKLDDAMRREIGTIFPAPPPATDRLEETADESFSLRG